jgi:hypothetical protein
MSLQEIELDDAELVVRVIARANSLARKPIIIEPGDFARKDYMSGISIWRARSKHAAMDAWSTKWKKGTLVCQAGKLKLLNLRFFETATEDHFTVRCDACDLSPHQRDQGPLCRRTDLAPCSFSLTPLVEEGRITELGLLDKLVQVFSVDLPINTG